MNVRRKEKEFGASFHLKIDMKIGGLRTLMGLTLRMYVNGGTFLILLENARK